MFHELSARMMKVSRIRGVLCWNVWLELECVVRAVKSE